MIRCILLFLLALGLSAQEVKLQILATNDMHGCILPENPYTLKPEARGWAKIATLIRRMKAQNPHTFLLDCGDNLQGDPLCYVRNRVRPDLPEPSMAIMNELGYLATTVGTHDLDWGLTAARAIEEKEASFPWLAANIEYQGKPAFTPYAIQEVAGVRVGILGLANSAINRFRLPQPADGLAVSDAVLAAQRYVSVLKSKEKADVVIVLFQSGSGARQSGPSLEFQAVSLIDRVPDIDLVISGYSHQKESLRHKGVPLLSGGSRGAALCVAELVLKKERGSWRLQSRDGRLVEPALDTPLDSKVLEVTSAARRAADSYLNTRATLLAEDLDGRWSRTEDSALVQLIHTVQKKATGAELSATHSPSMKLFIPKGPTSIRQFWALAPYEGKVACIKVRGVQLKQWLEQSARAFNFCHQPELFNKDIHGFNYDMIDGINYVLDLSKPVGQRVVDLRYKGVPVTENQTFKMAINTYRLSGDGGYMDAIAFKGQPDMVTQATLRNLILDYVLSQPTLNIPLQYGWRLIPALDRERILAQAK